MIFYGNGEADDDHRVYLIPSDDDRSVVVTNLAGLAATTVDRDFPVSDLIHPVNRKPPAPPGPPAPAFVSSSDDQAPALDPKEELVQYIEMQVDPHSWKDAGGKVGQVAVGGDHPTLHVHQTPANQNKVEAALARFRDRERAKDDATAQCLREHDLATAEATSRP